MRSPSIDIINFNAWQRSRAVIHRDCYYSIMSIVMSHLQLTEICRSLIV